MKYLLTFLLFNVLSAQAAAPHWYGDFAKSVPGCEADFLCASGEGDSAVMAINEARSEVARFFLSNIQTKSEVASTFEQTGTNAANGSISEWANKSISIESNEIISGLEIKKQEVVNGKVYVLVMLDKSKTTLLLKEKIVELDAENELLINSNSRFSYPRIFKNLNAIDYYQLRYNLLSSNKLNLKVKKEHVMAKLSKLSPIKVALVTVGKKLPGKLSHTLTALLSPLKIVIVSQKKSPQYIIKGEITTEERYLKVEGFKKINVVYKVELIDSKNEVIGKMSTFSEQVARNHDQAIDIAIPEIKEALYDNLDQLSRK